MTRAVHRPTRNTGACELAYSFALINGHAKSFTKMRLLHSVAPVEISVEKSFQLSDGLFKNNAVASS